MKIYYNPKLRSLARALRKNSTLSEILLWNELKGRQILGYQFMRQKPIGEFIVDFYCSKLKLVIEIDGDSHGSDRSFERDFEKDKFLARLGISVLRIEDQDVKKDMDFVLNRIVDWIEVKGK
jgi:very-short-patch-repair endonuclease